MGNPPDQIADVVDIRRPHGLAPDEAGGGRREAEGGRRKAGGGRSDEARGQQFAATRRCSFRPPRLPLGADTWRGEGCGSLRHEGEGLGDPSLSSGVLDDGRTIMDGRRPPPGMKMGEDAEPGRAGRDGRRESQGNIRSRQGLFSGQRSRGTVRRCPGPHPIPDVPLANKCTTRFGVCQGVSVVE